ncbi:MAG: hypothetical protein WCG44_04330, partial [bacterium]
ITATFTLKTFSITISTTGNGTGTLDQATQTVNYGANLTINATPAVSSNFTSWSGDSTDGTLANITANKTITATFTLKTFSITISTTGNGTGTLDQATQTVNYGANLTINATPAISSNFTGWSGDASGTGVATITNITANKTITATFTLKIYAIIINKLGNGDGTFDQASSTTVNSGDNLTVTATPADSSDFVSWSGCDSVNDTVCTLSNITADKTVTASFSIKQYMVNISKTGTGDGGLSQSSQLVDWDSNLSVIATANADSYFIGFTGCTSLDNTCAYTSIKEAKNLVAQFELKPSLVVGIENNVTRTNQTSLNLNIAKNATVDQMMISDHADFSGAGWQAYQDTALWNLPNPTVDGLKTVYLKAKDASGYESTVRSVSVTLDTTPPAAPTALSTTAGNGSISLSWFPPAGGPADTDFAKVAIFRSTLPDFVPDLATNKIGNTDSSSAQTYLDVNVENGVTYYYQIKSIDNADNYSAASNQSSAKADNDLPTTPGTLTIQNKTNSKDGLEYINTKDITLSWTPASTDQNSGLKGYLLSIGSSSNGNNVLDGQEILASSISDLTNPSVSISTLSSQLSALSDGTYYARLQAKDNVGNLSAVSSELRFVLDSTAPAITGKVIAYPQSDPIQSKYQVLLTWPIATDALSGVLGYSLVKDGKPLNLDPATNMTKDIQEDTQKNIAYLSDTITPDTASTYTVSAIDLAKNSSAQISFTLENGKTTIIVPKNSDDGIKLEISDVKAEPSALVGETTQAKITWRTTVPSTSLVNYGQSISYNFKTNQDNGLNTLHTVILSDLAFDTTYHFAVTSKDKYGNELSSTDTTFVTNDVLANQSVLDTVLKNLTGELWKVRDIVGLFGNQLAGANNAIGGVVNIPEKLMPAVSSGVATAIAVGATAAAPLANAATMFSLPEYLRSIFFSIGSIATKKRKKKWGKVTEAGSELPIVGARIDLVQIITEGTAAIDSTNGTGPSFTEKTIASTYSDKEGNYAFVAEPGEYLLNVVKDGYTVSNVAGAYSPTKSIIVSSAHEGLIVPSIVLSPSQESLQSKLSFLSKITISEKVLSYISILFLSFGTFTIISALIKNPNSLTTIILALIYPVLWYLTIHNLRKVSPFGYVEDMASHKGIPLSLIRIMDESGEKLLHTAISNEQGHYTTTMPKGNYKALVVKTGYESASVDFDATDKISVLNRKISLKKEGENE